MTEKQMYNWVKKHLPDALWQRIETSTAAGVPDVNYMFKQGVEGWIELKGSASISWKKSKNPKMNDKVFRLKIRPAQTAWIKERLSYGGRVFLLCWLKEGLMALIKPTSFKANDGDHVYCRGADTIEIFMTEQGAETLRAALTSRNRG